MLIDSNHCDLVYHYYYYDNLQCAGKIRIIITQLSYSIGKLFFWCLEQSS